LPGHAACYWRGMRKRGEREKETGPEILRPKVRTCKMF